jgi:tRNA(Ile2) C34 agmatinyltransferase TiaS
MTRNEFEDALDEVSGDARWDVMDNLDESVVEARSTILAEYDRLVKLLEEARCPRCGDTGEVLGKGFANFYPCPKCKPLA